MKIEVAPWIKDYVTSMDDLYTELTLEKLGNEFHNRCQLTLDGLDEHAFGQNHDVLKVIKGQKLLNTHVLVTSRPHSCRPVERHFETIVRVDGFTREQAKNFAYHILRNIQQVEYQCPILLSFMCLLVRSERIQIVNESINTGEIYGRMVRYLYKKFTIRKGINYDDKQFIASVQCNDVAVNGICE